MGDTAAFIRAAITVYWGSEVEQGEGSLKREVMVQDEKTEKGCIA